MAQQYHLPLPQREALSLEDFLPAPANEDAIGWLIGRTPDAWPAHALVLWGPEGTGKTHLLHIWCERMGAAKVEIGDTALLSQIVEGAAPVPAFAVDDADRVAACFGGDAATNAAQQEWLQHFYNATKAASTPVLLTSRTPPAQWGLVLRDIETRLKSCPAVALHEPDDDLMRGLLLKLFRDRQLMVEAGVVEYLAQRTDRTGAAIRKLVALLDEAALEAGRKISIPFAQKLLMQDQPKAEDDQNKNA